MGGHSGIVKRGIARARKIGLWAGPHDHSPGRDDGGGVRGVAVHGVVTIWGGQAANTALEGRGIFGYTETARRATKESLAHVVAGREWPPALRNNSSLSQKMNYNIFNTKLSIEIQLK